MKKYQINTNYIIRQNPSHYDDTHLKDEYQDEVYKFTKKFLDEKKFSKIVDIGCGSGFKLLKYFNEYDTIGIETDPCFSFLTARYPEKKWIKSGDPEKNFSQFYTQTDIIICADVIEHLLDPDVLITYINSFDYKYLVISTPDREKFINSNKNGPPINCNHVREWTFEEFDRYLKLNFRNVIGYRCEKQIECMFFVCEKYENNFIPK